VSDARSVIPVLLSGGAGTRLWPSSRESAPKQFSRLGSASRTMLGETLARAARVTDEAPWVLANAAHRFGVAEALREAGVHPRGIVLEPAGRGTAPALAVAALLALADGGDPILLALPADHWIGDHAAFERAVRAGLPAARDGRLVVFGVEPDRAHTGYGWIHRGAATGDAWTITRFAEKPDQATAARWLAEGGWVWNAGVFLFRADALRDELARFAPDLLAAARVAVSGAAHDPDFVRLPESFSACPAGAVDTVVFERTDRAVMVPLSSPWSDLGSWDALWESSARDEAGNAASGDVVLIGSTGSLVRSEHRLVVGLDLADVVVVETADAVLVAPRASAQRVKEAARVLKDAGRAEVSHHRRVARPWGVFERVAAGPQFQVKTLRVDPGQALSLQRHNRRAEHWIVVRGIGRVTIDGREVSLAASESAYIPVGAVHRLENPGTEPLVVVEVQTGDYLGEDDVERLSDRYGRV
jgi:mannose-1-phosphate guanylyltransferase/mannose-6-phosphate isomerase